MSKNSFRPRKFEDFEIVDSNGNVVGHIRVKPSGILWASKSAKGWRGVTLREFDNFMVEHGRKQKK